MASLIPPSASQHLGTTRRQLLKTGGMLLVGTVVLPPLRAQAPAAAASAPASAPAATAAAPGAYPVPSDKRVDSFIAIGADGSVVAYNGHVDLGTGVRTALGQLVADELDVALLRAAAAEVFITDITQKAGVVAFTFDSRVDVPSLMAVCTMPGYRSRLRLSAGEPPRLQLHLSPGEDALAAAGKLTEELRLKKEELGKAHEGGAT